MDANAYPGPAVISVYTTCQPEHGVADSMSFQQAKMAVETRAFPLFIHDPRKGEKLRERLSLVGNPAQKEDWWTPPKAETPLTFIDFARTEGRFAKQFDKNGNPSAALFKTQEDRLSNWRMLQELAGLR
jgi:pyruvate/2-oxoacid:ferredoxin oxidoreductase beta subunit